MKIIILNLVFIAFTIATGSQISKIRDLMQNLDHLEDSADALRKVTEKLINDTRKEFNSLFRITEMTIKDSVDRINSNVQKILNYSVNRTKALVEHLTQEIANNQVYQINYDNCLSTVQTLTSLSDYFHLRAKLSLETAVRLANASIRHNADIMTNMALNLETLSDSLNNCADDKKCILEVSLNVVDTNDNFLDASLVITDTIEDLPPIIISNATSAAAQVLYDDEEYACENADLVISCIKTYNDDNSNDGTSPPPGSTTPFLTDTDATGTDSTGSASTGSASTGSTDTPIINYCTHEPFNPDLF